MSEFEDRRPHGLSVPPAEEKPPLTPADVHPLEGDLDPEFEKILESASRLQDVVPDAVLVGGTASAIHARHRLSFDHDHVIAGLQERYAQVLAAVEATDGWATSPRATKPPMTIMGDLDGAQAGLRNLRRLRPLEVERIVLPSGSELTIPTLDECLRVKGYLMCQRNQVRDYLDVAAMAALELDGAAAALRGIDAYYVEETRTHGSVATALAERLAEPSPRDHRILSGLAQYKGLEPRWHDWNAVVETCQDIAERMLAR